MAAANFLTKAMALPAPPPPPQLALKGDWSEMNHARTTASLHIPTPMPLAPLHGGKMPKRALASNTFAIHNRDSDNDASRCPEGPSMDNLSEEAQRFLEEDPFDFAALPHPVLMRQQAVCNVYAPLYANTSEVDDADVAAGAEPIASAPELCNKPRWNASIVGASLAQAGRGWNVPLLTRSDGDLR